MRPIHLVVLAATSMIWGASFMLMKIMLDEMPPVAVAWLRLVGGSAFAAVVLVATGRRLPRSWVFWRDATVMSVLGAAIPMVMIPWGQREIPSNLGAILNGAMPFWVVILATVFLPAERATGTKVAGVLVGFAGLAVIIGPDALDLAAGSTQGQLAIVGAAACYAASAIYVRRTLLGVDSTILAAMQSGIALVVLTPLILALGDVPDVRELSTRTLVATAALALGGQGVAIILYYWLLTHVEATQASFVTYTTPIAALFWGWLVLAEMPTLAMIPGLGLIIVGVVLVNRPQRAAVEVLEPEDQFTRP